ncbi:MAG: O-antigen ligase family protein, partial [Candidatus Hydrogenedentes bacterium]|nr:O-antigen ligase family protein [Candidatus Hydrogenedentota bacterium]
MSPSADPSSPAGRLQALRGTILCAAILLTTLAWSFWWTAFAEVKTATLAASVLALGLGAIAARQIPRGGGYAFLPLWLFLGYANVVAHLRPAYSLALTAEENLRVLFILLTPLLGYDLLANPAWQTRIKQCIIAAGVLAALLGILQYLGLVPFLFPVFPNYTQPVYSVFGNQDLFGGFLAISLTLAALQFFNQHRISAPGIVVPLVLSIGLALSASRSAWLAAAAGILTAILMARPPRRRLFYGALALVLLAAGLAFVAPEQTVGRVLETFSAGDDGGRLRLWFWDGTWRMFASSPWFGKGLGNFAFYSPRYLGAALLAPGGERHAWNELHTDNAHCDPLERLAETGVLGALLVLWMLARLLRCRREEWAPLVTLAVFCLFNAAFQSAPHALAGVLLAGMLLSRRYEPGTPRGLGAALTAGAAAAASMALFLFAVFIPSYYLR